MQIPASPTLKEYTRAGAARMTGRVDPTVDNALKIISGGAKAALDPRIVGLPAAEVSKISEKRKLHSAINNPERLIK